MDKYVGMPPPTSHLVRTKQPLTHSQTDEWIESCISNPDKLAQAYTVANQGTEWAILTYRPPPVTDHDGIIKGSEAVQFFRGSGAPDHVLSYVWRVASRDSHHLSTDTELRTALGLLLEARNGRLPFSGAVRHDADTARRASAAAIAQHPDVRAMTIPPDALATYNALFSRLVHDDCEYVELADLKRFLAASWLQESAVDPILRAVVGEEDEIDRQQFAAVVHITLAAVDVARTIAQSMRGCCCVYTRHNFHHWCCITAVASTHDTISTTGVVHVVRIRHLFFTPTRRFPHGPPLPAHHLVQRPPPPLVFRV